MFRKLAVIIVAVLGLTAGLVPAPAPLSVQAASAATPYNMYGPEGTVYRLYRAYFLREPDQAGFNYWINAYRNGYPLNAISDDFARSNEFQTRYGNVDDRRFLKLVYNNVLGRAPDQGGYDYWLNEMDKGMRRGYVMIYFSDSAEYRNKTAQGVPPGYTAADPRDFAENFFRLDGTTPPLTPDCTGLLGLCLHDHHDEARWKLGEARTPGTGWAYWDIGPANVSIEFDNGPRIYGAYLLAPVDSGFRTTLFPGIVMGATTLAGVWEAAGEPHTFEIWGDACAILWYSYQDARSYDVAGDARWTSFGVEYCDGDRAAATKRRFNHFQISATPPGDPV